MTPNRKPKVVRGWISVLSLEHLDPYETVTISKKKKWWHYSVKVKQVEIREVKR